jgi:signal transduction histidine kinase
MLRSLRARLAFLFVGTLLLATVIAGVVLVGLYQSYSKTQTINTLRRQVAGVSAYYERALNSSLTNPKNPPLVASWRELERQTDASIYYAGPQLFPKGVEPNLPTGDVPLRVATALKGPKVVEFKPNTGDDRRTYVGVAYPLSRQGTQVGSIMLAKPLTDVNNAWQNVLGLVILGTLAGLVVAFVLATFVSRRITQPLTVIGTAADRVARGDLDVNVVTPGTSDDELGTLAVRFQGMVDRLREIDELERNFLMRVTHELRTPLTAISGHVQAVSEGVVEPEDFDESLVAVNEEVRRLERLVNDLLDLTRLEAHQFRVVQEEVGLEALLEQAAAGFKEIARANEVDFDTTTAAAPTVITDGDRVLQIVNNLLDNAFRWTPRGGKVKLACVTSSGVAAITVTDTGPGIAPNDHEAVFHPFYSRRGEGGTGLGLSIARELASALGGRLVVTSEPGAGATFTLSLPRKRRLLRR